jgi:hypothetical protein
MILYEERFWDEETYEGNGSGNKKVLCNIRSGKKSLRELVLMIGNGPKSRFRNCHCEGTEAQK